MSSEKIKKKGLNKIFIILLLKILTFNLFKFLAHYWSFVYYLSLLSVFDTKLPLLNTYVFIKYTWHHNIWQLHDTCHTTLCDMVSREGIVTSLSVSCMAFWRATTWHFFFFYFIFSLLKILNLDFSLWDTETLISFG